MARFLPFLVCFRRFHLSKNLLLPPSKKPGSVLFADVFLDEAIGTDATVPAFCLLGLGFLAKFPVDQLHCFDLFNFENALGFKIAPFCAAAMLSAVHVKATVIANCNLMHIN